MAKNKITNKKLEAVESFLDSENVNFLTGYFIKNKHGKE